MPMHPVWQCVQRLGMLLGPRVFGQAHACGGDARSTGGPFNNPPPRSGGVRCDRVNRLRQVDEVPYGAADSQT